MKKQEIIDKIRDLKNEITKLENDLCMADDSYHNTCFARNLKYIAGEGEIPTALRSDADVVNPENLQQTSQEV